VLSGHIAIFADRGAGRHKLLEWRAGDVAGMLPYSRLVSPPADSIALEASEVFAVPNQELAGMIRECHQITSILVHAMLDRSRHFTSSGLQDEKMISLGKLSAGLAHELNNPASAIERSAALLEERLDETERALARTVAGCDVTALAELPAYLELAIDVPGVEIGAPAVGTIEVALRSVAHQTK